jgi:hypothetical protein
MSAPPVETARLGPHTDNTFSHFTHVYYQAGSVVLAADELPPLDPTAREVELPRGSALLHHLASAVADGGVVYLTLYGRRVAAVLTADVAEALERSEPDREPGAGLREILDDMEVRVGPVPPEVAERMDREWGALAGR